MALHGAPYRLCAWMVESDIGDIRIILSIARDEGKVMLKGGGRDQQIKCPSSEFLTLPSQRLPNVGTPPGNRRRDGEDRNRINEGLQFAFCFLGGGAAQDSLVNLDVGDDADGNALIREPNKQPVCLLLACNMVNDPVCNDKIPHKLGRTVPAPPLLPGYADIRKQLLGIHARECPSAFPKPCSHPFGIVVCPNRFMARWRYLVEHTIFLQEQRRLIGFLKKASKFAPRLDFNTFGLQIHKRKPTSDDEMFFRFFRIIAPRMRPTIDWLARTSYFALDKDSWFGGSQLVVRGKPSLL